jgi:transcriptional regulator with XRE-family HTH domain
MSYFRVALQRAMEGQRLNQAELAREAGLSRSYVSRLFSGEDAALTDENMIALLKVFSSNPRTQAELVAARCMDARVGPGSEHVEIAIKTRDKVEDKVRDKVAERPQVPLGEEAERAFAWLRSQCPVNSDLEKHLISYARLVGMK